MKTLHEGIRETLNMLNEGIWDDIKHKFRNPNFDGMPPEAFDAPPAPEPTPVYGNEELDDFDEDEPTQEEKQKFSDLRNDAFALGNTIVHNSGVNANSWARKYGYPTFSDLIDDKICINIFQSPSWESVDIDSPNGRERVKMLCDKWGTKFGFKSEDVLKMIGALEAR